MLNQIRKNITPERSVKLLSILAFFFIILAITIIATTPPASGYEISIYDAFPWYFWFFLILSIAIGQIIIILSIFNENNKKNKIWLIGLIIVLIIISIVTSLPFSRGYVTYGQGDHLSHIGEAKDILFSGSIKSNDFYPNIHILTAVIGLIGDIDIFDVSTFLPRIFPFLFFFGFIIFSRFFLEKHTEFLLSIVFSLSILFFSSFGSQLAQWPQSFLLLPLILFLYFKRSTSVNIIPFDILFIILSISLVFYHPLTFLLLLMVFSMSAVSIFIFSKNKKHNQITTKADPEKKKVILPIMLLTIIFIAWYFSFSSIISDCAKIFSSIFYGTGESFLSTQLSMVSKYNVLLSDLLRIGFFSYGTSIIIGVLSLFSIIYLFYHLFWKKDKQVSQYKILFLSSCIFMSGGLAFLAFLFDFIVGWSRFYYYVIFFSLMLVPIALVFLFKPGQKSLNKTISYGKFSVILVIIFLVLCLSVFTFYASPLGNEPSQAVSSGECIGFTWFIKNRNTSYNTDELDFSQSRFFDAFHQKNSSSDNMRYLTAAAPDHFGYNDSLHLGSQYEMHTYLILTTLDRIIYPSIYPNYKDDWHFTEKDFQMLLDDSTVSTVYSNSGFDVFLINS